MMQRLRRFMAGRYGIDRLNITALGAGVVCSVCAMLFTRKLYVLADVLYFWVLFRALSKNYAARQKEEQKFLQIQGKVQAWWNRTKEKFTQRKNYKYFKCPNCKQQLRAPRGRGKIEVTCQKCRTVFRTKT